MTKDGPYRVEGGVPLLRTAIVQTERGEPIAWDEGPEFETPGEVYELCLRPVLDQALLRPDARTGPVRRHGDRGPRPHRRAPRGLGGEANHVLYDDLSLCTHAGFCRNVRTGVWEMVEEADDPEVRAEFAAMVQRCPSGRLAFAVLPDPEPVEPTFEPSSASSPTRPTGSAAGSRSCRRTRRRTRCAIVRPCAGAGSHATSRSATGRTSSTGSTTPRCRSERGSGA